MTPHILYGANPVNPANSVTSTLRSFLLALAILCLVPWAAGVAWAQPSDCVILLHGLGRSSGSMADMAEALQSAGFIPVNLDYPSREYPIENLAMDTIALGLAQCRKQGARKIHFLTHSMGGILLRYYLTQSEIRELGRVVMLSPPNQGSDAADALKDNILYQWFFGPAGQQLGTDPDGFVAGLGSVTYPVGIITGNKPTWFDGWLSEAIPGADDGKVSVERAKVKGMSDFLVLPYDHTSIMKKPAVIDQAIHFLYHGSFKTH